MNDFVEGLVALLLDGAADVRSPRRLSVTGRVLLLLVLLLLYIFVFALLLAMICEPTLTVPVSARLILAVLVIFLTVLLVRVIRQFIRRIRWK